MKLTEPARVSFHVPMYGGGESASVYVQGYLAWVRGDSVSTVPGHAGLLLRAVLGRLGGRRGGGRGEGGRRRTRRMRMRRRRRRRRRVY